MKKKLQIFSMLFICNMTILSNLNAQTTDQAAAYKGGQEAFLEYFEEKITFPNQGYFESRHTIDLYFKIHIGTDGTARITEFTKAKADDPVRAQLEAIVPNMPKWTPPICNGKRTETTLFAKIEYAKDKVIAAEYDTKEILVAIDIIELDTKDVEVIERDEKPFLTVERMPQYPGGQTELMNYIASNLRYPEESQKAGIQGRTTIRFVVQKDGSIADVQVMRGFDKLCDEEAVRVVKSMPKWVPGRQSGKIVPVYFTLPVGFRLRE